MDTEVLSVASSTALARATEVLRRGGLVAFPTDTVYGVGALAFHPKAVQRLYAVKGRPVKKAIPVLTAQVADVAKVAPAMSPTAQKLARAFWPGALTLVLPKLPTVPLTVSAGPTIAVRIPDQPWRLALLSATGPLAVSSANRSGGPNSLNAIDVLESLGGQIDLLIDGGPVPGGLPSTIVDCTVAPPAILRPGPISEADVHAALARY